MKKFGDSEAGKRMEQGREDSLAGVDGKAGTSGDSGSSPHSPVRRKLLIGALGVAPTIATLAGRPVWAKQCTVSGMLSGPQSGEMAIRCGGCTPGFWKTNPTAWPPSVHAGTPVAGEISLVTGECVPTNSGTGTCKVYGDDGTKFDAIFGVGSAAGVGLVNDQGQPLTLMQVLWLEHSTTHVNGALGAQAVAAVFNAARFPEQYGYTVLEIIEIFNFPPPEIIDRKAFFEALNSRGCPLSASG